MKNKQLQCLITLAILSAGTSFFVRAASDWPGVNLLDHAVFETNYVYRPQYDDYVTSGWKYMSGSRLVNLNECQPPNNYNIGVYEHISCNANTAFTYTQGYWWFAVGSLDGYSNNLQKKSCQIRLQFEPQWTNGGKVPVTNLSIVGMSKSLSNTYTRNSSNCEKDLISAGIDWGYWSPGSYKGAAMKISNGNDSAIVYVNNELAGVWRLPYVESGSTPPQPTPAYCEVMANSTILDHGNINKDSWGKGSASIKLNFTCNKAAKVNFNLIGKPGGSEVDLNLGGGVVSKLCVTNTTSCLASTDGLTVTGNTSNKVMNVISTLSGNNWQPGVYTGNAVLVVGYW